MYRIKVRENKQKKQQKTVGEKHAYVQGLDWATVEVKEGHQQNITESDKHIKRRLTGNLAR